MTRVGQTAGAMPCWGGDRRTAGARPRRARRCRAHLRELERGLPDALDLMVICAEAGLALEAG